MQIQCYVFTSHQILKKLAVQPVVRHRNHFKNKQARTQLYHRSNIASSLQKVLAIKDTEIGTQYTHNLVKHHQKTKNFVPNHSRAILEITFIRSYNQRPPSRNFHAPN